MDEKEFLSLVEETLEVSAGTVSLTDGLEELDWDSLANISFIAELDSRHGIPVDAATLAKCTTVQDLFDLADAAIKAK